MIKDQSFLDDKATYCIDCAKKNSIENIIRITADCPLIEPKLIDRIQDSEGNTIFKTEVRKCRNCEDVSIHSNDDI